MDKILEQGNNIGEWETKEITNLNPLYAYAEKELSLGHKMYAAGQIVETFVLFMRVTKLYDLVNKNNHRILPTRRHYEFKNNVKKVVLILEMLKLKLVKKYGDPTPKNIIEQNQEVTIILPTPPSKTIPRKNLIYIDIDDSELKDELTAELERRWAVFAPKLTSKPPPKSYPNTTTPQVSQINNQPEKENEERSVAEINYKDKDNNPLDALSILKKHLTDRNLQLFDVPGDNNCQFHAIAHQLHNIGIKDWTALSLRKSAVKWLTENANVAMDDSKIGETTVLKDAIGVHNWKEYIKEMSQHGVTWGDEATLLAISAIFKLTIIIISSLPGNYAHTIKPPPVWNIETTNTIYLGHYHEFHYVSTISC